MQIFIIIPENDQTADINNKKINLNNKVYMIYLPSADRKHVEGLRQRCENEFHFKKK